EDVGRQRLQQGAVERVGERRRDRRSRRRRDGDHVHVDAGDGVALPRCRLSHSSLPQFSLMTEPLIVTSASASISIEVALSFSFESAVISMDSALTASCCSASSLLSSFSRWSDDWASPCDSVMAGVSPSSNSNAWPFRLFQTRVMTLPPSTFAPGVGS